MKGYGTALCCACLLMCSAGAFGATAYIYSNDPNVIDRGSAVFELVLDKDPLTEDSFRFEVIVDTCGLTAADSYEYLLRISPGLGLEFDFIATEDETTAVANDPLHIPRYLLFDDSLGVYADEDYPGDPTTITVSDLSDSGSTYNPLERPSLGIFVIKVTDEAAFLAACPPYGPGQDVLDGGVLIGSDEELSVNPITLTPEPATMALLAIGGLGFVLRRRKAA